MDVQKWRDWLRIGMGIKRWLIGMVLGASFGSFGVTGLVLWGGRAWVEFQLPTGPNFYRFLLFFSLLLLLLGFFIAALSLWVLWRQVSDPFRTPEIDMADAIFHYQRRHRGPKIVAIGGGTGSSTLLRGLTKYTSNITAIVTVADDGGSSGRLRREFGILPPGDFRNNIAALSRDETLMAQLLQYRFGSGLQAEAGANSGLRGHAFGNLLITALVGLTGSFEEALSATRNVLALRGQVFPSTLTPITLIADVERDGRLLRIEGESAIPEAKGRIQRLSLSPDNARGYPAAVHSILNADVVVIGPGSLYTSILPNLLVREIATALKSTNARRVYVCNVATQNGETDAFSVSDHYNELVSYIPVECIDQVLINSNYSIPAEGKNKNTIYVKADTGSSELPILTADLVDEAQPWRHDSHKLAAALIGLLSK
ncbi:MAG: uridine diphosphate-N-acetylglucosamine-binding protein YvcK [Chloroflexota bacterium]